MINKVFTLRVGLAQICLPNLSFLQRFKHFAWNYINYDQSALINKVLHFSTHYTHYKRSKWLWWIVLYLIRRKAVINTWRHISQVPTQPYKLTMRNWEWLQNWKQAIATEMEKCVYWARFGCENYPHILVIAFRVPLSLAFVSWYQQHQWSYSHAYFLYNFTPAL